MNSKSQRGGLRNPPGGRPPKPDGSKYHSFSLRLPPDLDDWLRARKSADSKFNMNGFIANAIREKIETM